MADETTRADEWIRSVLVADTTVAGAVSGVFGDLAPEGATFPYVLFQFQGGADVRGSGPTRIMVSGLWVVRAVAQQSTYLGVLQTVADRVDVLMQATSGAAGSDGQVFSSVREQPFRMTEVLDGGEQVRHLGGIYRLLVQVAA